MPVESFSADDSVNIRIEDSDSFEERALIRTINKAAFGGPDEAELVDKLRADGDALISLVAELDTGLVGHILFSRMWIRSQTGALVSAVALAPVAVLPEYQRKGIGGRLVRNGLELLRGRGEKIAIVVGHPDSIHDSVFPLRKPNRSKALFQRKLSWRSSLVRGLSMASRAQSCIRLPLESEAKKTARLEMGIGSPECSRVATLPRFRPLQG